MRSPPTLPPPKIWNVHLPPGIKVHSKVSWHKFIPPCISMVLKQSKNIGILRMTGEVTDRFNEKLCLEWLYVGEK